MRRSLVCLAAPLLALTGCSPSFGLNWTVGAADPAAANLQLAREYVGPVTGSDAVIGLVVTGNAVRAYVGGGDATWKTQSGWYQGTLSGASFTATSADGKHVLSGSLTGGDPPSGATGSVALADGTQASWSAAFANAANGAGVYQVDDAAMVASVVVNNDGRAQGVATAKAGGGVARVALSRPASVAHCLAASVTLPGETSGRAIAIGDAATTVACQLPPPVAARAGVTLVVDSQNGAADDANDGTEAHPFKTIQAAIDAAGDNSHVVVRPGVYREALRIEGRNNFEIDAKYPNTVTVTGSDLYTGWQPDPAHPGAYTHPWAYQLGSMPNLYADNSVTPLGSRMELLAVNGTPLRQVLTPGELAANTFCVSDQEHVIRMRPATYLPTDAVEVAVRPITSNTDPQRFYDLHPNDYLCLARNVHGLHLTGLTFTFSNRSLAEGPAAMVDHCTDVALVNCAFNRNSGSGVELQACSGVVLTNVQADDNGTLGLLANAVSDGSGSTVELARNNGRGVQGWAAGMRWVQARNVSFEHLKVHDNPLAPGVWFDTACTNAVVQDLASYNNRIGLEVEAGDGPLTVRGSLLAVNDVGLLALDAAHLTVEDDVLAHNRQLQLQVANTLAGSSAPDASARGAARRLPSGWTLRTNLVVADAACPAPLIDTDPAGGAIAGYDSFFPGIQADGNGYYHAGRTSAFRGPTGTLLDFAGWQKVAGEAASSFSPGVLGQANARLDQAGVPHP